MAPFHIVSRQSSFQLGLRHASLQLIKEKIIAVVAAVATNVENTVVPMVNMMTSLLLQDDAVGMHLQ